MKKEQAEKPTYFRFLTLMAFHTFIRENVNHNFISDFLHILNNLYKILIYSIQISIYLFKKVDVAIIECGIGGEYDSTNIIEKPVVSAITSLGIDHQHVLGNTLKEIAWHKSGIIKVKINSELSIIKKKYYL